MRRLISCVLLLCSLLSFCACRGKGGKETLQIYFLDVGQGDCILLRCADGDVLIDAGPEQTEELLCLRLEQLGIKELELAVFTHSDEDHIGGADGVLSRFPVKEIWYGGFSSESPAAKRMLETAKTTGVSVCEVLARRVYRIGKLVLGTLAPLFANSSDPNESGIVLRIQYGETVAIFSGDVGEETEERMVREYGVAQLSCDLYKVGHHGADNASGIPFLQAMMPQYAVISCGAGNSHGHPSGTVLARLEDVGSEVLRTDLLGEIQFQTDGKTLWCVSGK